jgi:transcriptional regulator with XRE-family HTH domain
MENMNLRIARVKRKISQWELSYKTKISQGRISLFESGFRQPTKEQAEKIADVLQVDIKEIFSELLPRWRRNKRNAL